MCDNGDYVQPVEEETLCFKTNVPNGEISALIGKGGSGVKKCISNSWRMYEKFQSSDKKVEEEKPTLRIFFKKGDDSDTETNVSVDIISHSNTMQKLAYLSIKKHVGEYVNKKDLASHSFVVEYPHNLIGHFIGKGWKNAQTIVSSICENIDVDDVETARTGRLNVSPNPQRPYPQFDNIKTTRELLDFVSKRPGTCFNGWPPEESDEFTQYIMITVSFHRNAKPFKDRSAYIEKIQEAITESVQEIKSKNDDEMDEINEHMGF